MPIEEDDTSDFAEEFENPIEVTDQAILPYESLKTKYGLHLVQLEDVEEEMTNEPQPVDDGTKATSTTSITSEQESTTSVAISELSISSAASVSDDMESIKVTASAAATNLMAFKQDSSTFIRKASSSTLSLGSKNVSTTSVTSAPEETAVSDNVSRLIPR